MTIARRLLSEGTWFAVPLRSTGYSVGVIARTNRKGVVLAYFFGPRFDRVPGLSAVSRFSAADALAVVMVGDYALHRGEWPLIGQSLNWDRDSWPLPPMARYEELTGRWFIVHFDDHDPAVVASEQQTNEGTGKLLPRAGLMGSGYAEQYLTARLDPN